MDSDIQNARHILEQAIIQSAAHVGFPGEKECFDQDALSQFERSWYALSKYYENTNDLEISVWIVRLYLYYVDCF